MSQPVKNAEGVTFQLAMLTAADGSQVQCIAIVGADGMPITAWPLPEGAATESGQASIAAAVSALAQALGAGLSVTNFPASQTVAGTVNVGNFPADLAKEGGKLTELSAVLGAAADASAASDSGAFSVVALIKRGLASLTSIFGRTAPLVNTRYPVEVGNFPATLATTAAVQEVRDRLPETAHSQPLTDTQLRAAPVPVNAATRACVGRETIALAAAGTASLTVPVGAVAAHVQAENASIRIRLDGQAPTATVGTRLDDGVIYPVDSTLAGVRLYGVGACNVQVVYFDRA